MIKLKNIQEIDGAPPHWRLSDYHIVIEIPDENDKYVKSFRVDHGRAQIVLELHPEDN